MLFSVDFDIKINQSFSTVHTEIIPAISISECQDKAEQIREQLPLNQNNHIHIFIEEVV
ncbi:hypothetical protein GCM10008967_00110 [Bacillus carboniphilus]|uniref:Uncharacterized protein n=1 Tax=Bacillus carboniphilus TaxID=86663 RepID=A0ABN0VNZ4_9BACI